MQSGATFLGNRSRLEAVPSGETDVPMAAQLTCFLLGALAPLAIVGWLLVAH
jgi:hypothetical protein